jgi:hypothetical protein
VNNFVAVVGPSGSGRSSPVFAGLLPALRQERQTRTWDVVSLRPGAWPLRGLATVFGTAPQNAGPAEIDAYLEKEIGFYRVGDAETLARIVNDSLDAALEHERPDRLLIYVDQWEEPYAMAPPAEDSRGIVSGENARQHFLRLAPRLIGCEGSMLAENDPANWEAPATSGSVFNQIAHGPVPVKPGTEAFDVFVSDYTADARINQLIDGSLSDFGHCRSACRRRMGETRG